MCAMLHQKSVRCTLQNYEFTTNLTTDNILSEIPKQKCCAMFHTIQL